MENNKTLQRRSLRDQVRDRVLDAIASGEFKPGDRIVEARLAEKFQVSSIPVREALRELVTVGILGFADHKGVWVRELRLKDVIEVVQVRIALDVLAVELAAPKLRGHCESLRKILVLLKAAAAQRDYMGIQRSSQAMYREVIVTTGNEILLRVWDQLALQARMRFAMEILDGLDAIAIANRHESIVEALDQGDGRRAAKLLTQHSKYLVGHLQKQIAKRQQTPDSETPSE